MSTAARKKQPPGQALERFRPQERALLLVAAELGIVRYAEGGGMLIDLTSPALHAKYNVLAPAATIAKGDPNFTPAISVVTLNPDLQAGDFYEIEKPRAASGNFAAKPGAWALSKRALDVIGKQAGIEDLSPEIVYFGDRDQNVRVTWHCRVRRPDGTFQTLSGTREWIEEDEKALLDANPPEWALKNEAARRKWWAENWYGRVKKFRLPMTESKARLRAYRQALTLKAKYTPEEAHKPFLVASTTFTPDTADPDILRMVFTGGEQATDLLYGPPAVLAAPADDAIDGICEKAPVGADRITGEALDEDPAREEYRPRPETDLTIPRGPYAGGLVSEVARTDPDYCRDLAVATKANPKWGPVIDEWLRYWHGEGGEGDDVIPF